MGLALCFVVRSLSIPTYLYVITTTAAALNVCPAAGRRRPATSGLYPGLSGGRERGCGIRVDGQRSVGRRRQGHSARADHGRSVGRKQGKKTRGRRWPTYFSESLSFFLLPLPLAAQAIQSLIRECKARSHEERAEFAGVAYTYITSRCVLLLNVERPSPCLQYHSREKFWLSKMR